MRRAEAGQRRAGRWRAGELVCEDAGMPAGGEARPGPHVPGEAYVAVESGDHGVRFAVARDLARSTDEVDQERREAAFQLRPEIRSGDRAPPDERLAFVAGGAHEN